MYRRPRYSKLHADHRDYTKRRSYVGIDLSVRALSAIGIIIIGAAGLLFQLTTERARASTALRNEQNRTYLPKIRSLAELEIALDDVAGRLSLIATSDVEYARHLLACSSRVESAATSTMVIEKDPEVPVDLPNIRGISLTSDRQQLGVRASAFMFADILRVVAASRAAHVEAGENPTVGLTHLGREWAAAVYNGVKPVRLVKLRQDSVAPWRAWIGDIRVPVDKLEILLRATARALQLQAATESQLVVREHPEFGDQYVMIRMELAKSRFADPSK